MSRGEGIKYRPLEEREESSLPKRYSPCSLPSPSSLSSHRVDWEAWVGQALTLPLHAGGQALLIAAVLTAVPLALVHRAVLVVPARVGQVLTDGALEEAFAALTAVNPVVFACEGTGRAVRLHADPVPLGLLPTSPQQI